MVQYREGADHHPTLGDIQSTEKIGLFCPGAPRKIPVFSLPIYVADEKLIPLLPSDFMSTLTPLGFFAEPTSHAILEESACNILT